MSYKKTAIAFIVTFIVSAEAFLFFDINYDYKKIAFNSFLIGCTVAILQIPLINWYRRTFVKQYKYNATAPQKHRQYKLFADISNVGDPRPVPVNIKNADNGYEIHVVAPGLPKEGFKVDITGLQLTVSYNKISTNKKVDNWLKMEYFLHSFSRRFVLDDLIDTTKITAIYKDGILQLILPKKQLTETAKTIEIK